MNIEYVKILPKVEVPIRRGDTVRYKDRPETTYFVIETDKGLGLAGLETGFTYTGLPRDLLEKVEAKLIVEIKS